MKSKLDCRLKGSLRDSYSLVFARRERAAELKALGAKNVMNSEIEGYEGDKPKGLYGQDYLFCLKIPKDLGLAIRRNKVPDYFYGKKLEAKKAKSTERSAS